MQVVKNRFDGDVGKCPLEFHADSLTLSGYLKQQLQTKPRPSEHSPQSLRAESSETVRLRPTGHQSTGAKRWQEKRSGGKSHISADSKQHALKSLSQQSKKLIDSKPMQSASTTPLTPLSVNTTPLSVSSDNSTTRTGMKAIIIDGVVDSDSTADDCIVDTCSDSELPSTPSSNSDALVNEIKFNLEEPDDAALASAESASASHNMQRTCWSELCSQCDS